MKTRTRLLTATTMLGFTSTMLGVTVGAQAQEAFAPTTTDRLLNADAEPQNWLLYNGNYSNWRYSQLDQINTENVANLRIAYMYPVGGCSERPTTGSPECNGGQIPLVDNGIMYVNDNYSRLMALDVRSGDAATMLWRFDGGSTEPKDRGIALYENMVIDSANSDPAGIFALDKQSGELIWEAGIQEPVDQPNTAEMIALRELPTAEQVYPTAGGQQILTVGMAGPGVGWLAAYNANNGELIWRTYTIPQPGEPNFGTWPGETWRSGRATTWGPPPAFDPESNLLYFGAGEPSPSYNPEFRPGDNLYAVSSLAVDADTGEIAWYFQEVPNDQQDYDSTSGRLLYDLTVDGQTRAVVGNWGRPGYLYTLDRTTGEFLSAFAQLDNINWTAGIDPKTGKPVEYNPAGGLQTYAVAGPRRGRSAEDAPRLCATHSGAPTGVWQASYDPTTGVTYQTRDIGCEYQTLVVPTEENYNPLAPEMLGGTAQRINVENQTALIAIDTASGAVRTTGIRDVGISGSSTGQVGAMATAGGLVFTGYEDGRVSAFDKDTLDELWHFNLGIKLHGSLMSFAIDGKQYVGVIAGGRTVEPIPNAGNTLVVFSLPD